MPAIEIEKWIDQDLSLAAREGRLPPAFETDVVVRQIEEVLRADPPRSPIVTGRSGIGKTAVIGELVRRAVAGEGSPLLKGHRVVQLSIANISAQFKDKEQAADFARQLFDALAAEEIIPFVRDFGLAYTLDWEPIIYRFLTQSGRPLLGEAPAQLVDQMIDWSSDLAAHLVPVPVEEPRGERLSRIVAQWAQMQEARTHRSLTPEAQSIAMELTGRFLGDRPFPRKVLDLLAQTRDLAQPDPYGVVAVRARDVVTRFAATTRVPARLVDPDVPLDLDEMRRFLAERLLGQEEAVDAAVRMVALIKAGLTDATRPFGVFLFVGPTGVGKTHTAQLLAEYLFGARDRIIRINLTEFADEHAVTTLFGDPTGYNLDAKVGVLSKRLRGQPFGVLLLDEFEKASTKVHNAFMQLLDEGRFINGIGDTISVTSLIVIATSNAGAEVYRESGLGFRDTLDVRALDAELDRRLHKTFLFELLNRFDRVVHFHPLERLHIRAIAHRELGELLKRPGIPSRKLAVEVDAEVIEWLAAHGYHPHYGARFLRREIERNVTGALADLIVRASPQPGARIQVSVRGDRVLVRIAHNPIPTATIAPEGKTRVLDRDALVAEARAWVERWAPLHAEAETRRETARGLIERSNAPGFWDDSESAEQVLRQYTSLEARTQADERLGRPAVALARIIGDRKAPLDELGTLVEEAARNYRRCLDLGAATGPDAAWLWIAPNDPLAPCSEWVAAMVGMYTGWFGRGGLQARVVAEEEARDEVVGAVLRVEGPGVLRMLEMEHGRHRRRRGDDVDRARVEVIPCRAGTAAAVEDARHVRGRFVEKRVAKVLVEAPARGLRMQWYGGDRVTLGLLAADLTPVLAAGSPELEVARTYGITGGAVRDPRTNAVAGSIKDVLRGNLERFLNAWEDR